MISPPPAPSLDPARFFNRREEQRAVALVIVLAFVVLLTGLLVAFFSSSLLYRQISNSSANETKVDLFADGAVDTIVGDLKQEIGAGSNATVYTDANGNVLGQSCIPANAYTAAPALALQGSPSEYAGITSYAPNLVKRSAYMQNFFPGGTDTGASNYTAGTAQTVTLSGNTTAGTAPTKPSNRAANIASTVASQNGRLVSLKRWNKALLLPKYNPALDTDFTPINPANAPVPAANYTTPATGTNEFVAPDWVLVARDGSNPVAFNSNMASSTTASSSVVGRYAYAMYDEGGLLDANVAGYPFSGSPNTSPAYTASNSDLATSVYKSALAFADLTQLPGLSAPALSAQRQQTVINSLVGWRNFASGQATTGTLAGGEYTFPNAPAPSPWPYSLAVLGNPYGFLQTVPIPPTTYNTMATPLQTDRMFSSRQQLIDLVLNGIALQAPAGQPTVNQSDRANLENALQYLSSFSRGLDQPSYVPATHSSPTTAPKVLPPGSFPSEGGNNAYTLDREINPSFLTVRTPVAFTHYDGSTAAVGDVLVNKRFPLQRLAWLTYKGYSAGRPQTDPDIAALIAAGIPYSYLQLGTAQNISEYFGLTWDGTSKWLYNVHNNSVATGRGAIMRVGRDPSIDPSSDPTHYIQDLTPPRDPDFFELLKATLTVGSLGKTLASSNTAVAMDTGAPDQTWEPYDYNHDPEASTDRQVMQIGANIIGQSRTDNYPVQIDFDDGVGNRNAAPGSPTKTTITGIANLPYLYNVVTSVLQVRAPVPLPRQDATGNTLPGTGTGGHSVYIAGDTITDCGIGAVMQMPVIWNPHDPSSPVSTALSGNTPLSPTSFRVVADSTTPDRVGLTPTTGTYGSFFAYGSTTLATPMQSQQADASSSGTAGGGNTWYRSPSLTGQEIAQPITASNSAVYFAVTSTLTPALPLCPEPAILFRAKTIIDSNSNSLAITTNSQHRLASESPVSSLASGGGLPNYIPNAPGPNWTPAETASTRYLGFYLGAFPWAWSGPPGNAPASAQQSGIYVARYSGTAAGATEACYLTYRMQYESPTGSGNWITYDMKYGKSFDGQGNLPVGNICPSASPSGALLSEGLVTAGVVDPRSSRFGMHWNRSTNNQGQNDPTSAAWIYTSPYNYDSQNTRNAYHFIDASNGILPSQRPDAQTGFYYMTNWAFTSGMPTANSGWMAWVSSNNNSYPGFASGLFAQNNTDICYAPSRFYADGVGNGAQTPNYFADADGIVRRGMAAFIPYGGTASPDYNSGFTVPVAADTTVGLPLSTTYVAAPTKPVYPCPSVTRYIPATGASATALSQAQSRPYFLHRPFHSVAELANVFSDTPWRNLDLSTPESGSAALLDVFCVNENDNPAGMVAGKVDLNSRQAPVLQSILAGAYLDPASPTGTSLPATSEPMDAATATLMASALNNYETANGPLQNVAELVGKWVSNQPIKEFASYIVGSGGVSQGTLTNPKTGGTQSFYDGKMSYTGFIGGQWDNTNQKPKSTSPPADVYSAYLASMEPTTNQPTFPANSPDYHNGAKETVAYIQRFRTAPLRALAASGQTRVWNLMIDLVAQTGRYPQSATGASNPLAAFVVEGEQRYWVHLAIDRFTGQVIDKQVEIVKE